MPISCSCIIIYHLKCLNTVSTQSQNSLKTVFKRDHCLFAFNSVSYFYKHFVTTFCVQQTVCEKFVYAWIPFISWGVTLSIIEGNRKKNTFNYCVREFLPYFLFTRFFFNYILLLGTYSIIDDLFCLFLYLHFAL